MAKKTITPEMQERLQREKQIKMTTEKPEKLILMLAIPTIISMLITSFYNLADTFFVGQLGNTSATAAVSVAGALMAIIQAFGFFCGHGSGNFISRELGKNNVKEAEKMASVGFFTALGIGTLIMLLGFAFLEPLCILLGSTDTALTYTKEYLGYILIGAPYMCASLVLNNQLRFQSNALFAMVGLVSGGLLNIALDPIFIFGFNMGVKGAAVATIVSQAVSFVLLFVGVQKSDSLKIKLSAFKPSKMLYSELVKGGTPSLCRQGLNSIASMVLNGIAGDYGDAAITAIGVVTKIMMFASSALIGFGQGFQPVCGFSYGARLYKRVKKSFRFCVRSSVGFLLVLAIVAFIFAPQIVELFQKDDPEVSRIGAIALRAQLLTFPLMAWVVMANMMTQTIGKTVKASLPAMSRNGLMFIPAVVFLPMLLDLYGLVLAQPVADLLSFAMSIPIMIPELRELDTMKDASEDF